MRNRREAEALPPTPLDGFDEAVAELLLDMPASPSADEGLWRQARQLVAAVHSLWRRGHAALPLDAALLRDAGLGWAAELVDDPRTQPALKQLRAAGLLGDGSDPEDSAPLQGVLQGNNPRLGLARAWWAEQRIAAELGRLLGQAPSRRDPATPALVETLLGRDPDPQQAAALAAVLQTPVFVLTGGPGTGKTWLSARMLALWMADWLGQEQPLPRIVAVAPTGKAAARFEESLGAAIADASGHMAAVLRERIGEARTEVVMAALQAVSAQTVHRALGLGRRSPLHQLEADLVIVDEGSMVDLELMAALLAAMPAGARLIVLGDTAQLASVAAGTVFSDLVAAGGKDMLLAGRVGRLRGSRRFPDGCDLGKVAAAIQALDTLDTPVAPGSADKVVELLRAAQADIRWMADLQMEALLQRLAAPYAAETVRALAGQARNACEGKDPEAARTALQQLIESYRILTPFRDGLLGVEAINAELGARLGAHWAPVLITRNDYAVGLMNGDLGIRFGDGVWFPAAAGVRRVSVAMLPPHEPAWAMTIHKSQGSEYDRVAVVLPPREGPGRELVTRELLFTGLTRARIPEAEPTKVHLELFAAETDLREALGRRALRFGGLLDRLRSAQRGGS